MRGEGARERPSSGVAEGVAEGIAEGMAPGVGHGECEHEERSYVSGRHFGQCARCRWTCNVYGYRCGDCRLIFCQTCHHHRM